METPAVPLLQRSTAPLCTMGLRELLFTIGAVGVLLAGILMVRGSGVITRDELDPDDPGPEWSQIVRWRRWAIVWLIIGLGSLAALYFIR